MLGASRVDAEVNFDSPSFVVASGPSVTSLHRLEVVNRAAGYIADNLGEPIGLEDISRAVGMSKFHLHRVFEENVGSTLGRYLSGARLRAALHILSAPDKRSLSVLEVALQVGFEDASAFSRSFHRRYGLTPSSVRQGNRPREFPVPSSANPGLGRDVAIVRLPEFWSYGYEVGGQKNKTFTAEAPDGFKLSRDTIQRHGIDGLRGELGLPNHYSWVLREDACRLLCGFRSSTRLRLGSMDGRLMRSGTWLRVRHTGPHATRWQTWTRLQLQQLRFGRPQDGRKPFEEVVAYDPDRPERTGCDVYFPC